MCEARGIQLIHIFENEWEFKREIVESRIKNLLGIYDNTVFARKCEIKEIDSKTSKEFQEINHIQGSVNSSVNVGLYHGNELVSLMTFGKCRFDRKHEWEMLRFCNRLGHHVIGGAGKLLKYFEKRINRNLWCLMLTGVGARADFIMFSDSSLTIYRNRITGIGITIVRTSE